MLPVELIEEIPRVALSKLTADAEVSIMFPLFAILNFVVPEEDATKISFNEEPIWLTIRAALPPFCPPCMSSAAVGVVVPIPVLPLNKTVMALALALSALPMPI